ncbi:serine O-acetyltransferase [Aureibacter tunicatorum]|uniref:Serine acetyltransferase n=1 Tax=Aureibacter tunicatorum TaxID=866807 RepID=A0AAE3XLL0_9BACT|nr:hypothetical protein [Aureibacter tunicatorum]MDR6240156.1 serine O-acetyltransferase [Aureibacter tunicatorum]BDD05963.1 hypothetical protein AUTU_34460 [Aureibacter tunicatorum]
MKIVEDYFSKFESKKNSKSLVKGLVVLLDVNFWIVIIFRISSFFSTIKMYPLAKVFWLINRVLFSVDIDPRARLAGGLSLVHGIGIVIGHEVRSLGRLKIYQGVTLGGNYGKVREIKDEFTGQPVIDDNVIVGINSTVLGPVLLGKNSKIGTGAIVTKDVTENTTIVGVNKSI